MHDPDRQVSDRVSEAHSTADRCNREGKERRPQLCQSDPCIPLLTMEFNNLGLEGLKDLS